ncbi:MAG TPA: molybdate ABC transporter permease subunit [Opitutae bacterium]|nr:molybdate ABC transporter permease subunit [Opitutae bacterium]|tara:strand:+ start:794 stop:1447 length:654 start_codon:yes stop_codon:yes gene_type:complete
MDFAPLWISLKTAIAATVIAFVLGICAARWRWSRNHHVFDLLDMLILLPAALPSTVLGLLLLSVLGRHTPIGALLAEADLSIVFTWAGNVVVATVVAFPLMYQVTRAAFQQVDSELIDVARIFGLSEWHILCKVLIPLAWPGIAIGTILAFTRALGEFGATLMVAGNIPGVTQTTPIAIFFSVEAGESHRAMGFGLILMAVAIAATTAVAWLNQERD